MKTVFVNRRSNQACAGWTLRFAGAKIHARQKVAAHQDTPETHKTPGDSSELL
jgi:hypothetical protein